MRRGSADRGPARRTSCSGRGEEIARGRRTEMGERRPCAQDLLAVRPHLNVVVARLRHRFPRKRDRPWRVQPRAGRRREERRPRRRCHGLGAGVSCFVEGYEGVAVLDAAADRPVGKAPTTLALSSSRPGERVMRSCAHLEAFQRSVTDRAARQTVTAPRWGGVWSYLRTKRENLLLLPAASTQRPFRIARARSGPR